MQNRLECSVSYTANKTSVAACPILIVHLSMSTHHFEIHFTVDVDTDRGDVITVVVVMVVFRTVAVSCTSTARISAIYAVHRCRSHGPGTTRGVSCLERSCVYRTVQCSVLSIAHAVVCAVCA